MLLLTTHTHIPLWHNPQLQEISYILDIDLWASTGVIYLHQVLTPTGMRPFQSLKEEFEIPSYVLFRYLQLRHALQTQFREFPHSTKLTLSGRNHR